MRVTVENAQRLTLQQMHQFVAASRSLALAGAERT